MAIFGVDCKNLNCFYMMQEESKYEMPDTRVVYLKMRTPFLDTSGGAEVGGNAGGSVEDPEFEEG